MFARQLIPCTAFVLLTSVFGCGGGDSTEPNDPVASITISPSVSQLAALGETVQLSAAVRTQGGANANATVTWQSSAPQIASVDGNGLVRAVANGSAQITATVGTVSGTADVTVQQVATRVSVTPARDSIFTGATLQLTAAATDRSSATIASPRATWSSNDTSVAVVSTTGLVTGRKRGQARITVRVDTASAGTDIIVRLTSILLSRDTTLTGLLQVDRFEVAAGRTVTLMGDLTLRAEGPVVLGGTIRGDCRAIDVVTLGTLSVRGVVDNTCGDKNAAGKRLRLVSGGAYTFDSARVASSGEILVTNDTTINLAPSLGSSAARGRLGTGQLAAPCTITGGSFGLGLALAAGAAGSPTGAIGRSADPIVLGCSADMTIRGTTIRPDHGADGGAGSSTTPDAAHGGHGGAGGSVFIDGRARLTLDGVSLHSGDGGQGAPAFHAPGHGGRHRWFRRRTG